MVDPEEFLERVEAAMARHVDGWVCEGNYSRIAEAILRKAGTIVWLHLPWRVSFWRLLKRTVWRAATKEPLYDEDGPRESWRMAFFSTRSILWWAIHHQRSYVRGARERIKRASPEVQVIELCSSREVSDLLRQIASTPVAS